MKPGQTRFSVLLAALVSVAPPSGAADEPIDGPKVKFIDPFIENLVGDWGLTRSIRGRTVKNAVKAEWVLDHHFLKLHMRDVAVPPMYEAIVLIGYSNADKEYVAHWCDVFGGRYSAIGRGKLSGDHIEFAFQYPDGPFYNTFTWSGADGTWTMKLENPALANKEAFSQPTC